MLDCVSCKKGFWPGRELSKMFLCVFIAGLLVAAGTVGHGQQALSQSDIQQLIDKLNDSGIDEQARKESRDTLLFQDFNKVRELLKKELEKPERRLCALDLYAEFGREEGTQDILKYFKGDDRDVQKAAMSAAAKIGGDKGVDEMLNEMKKLKAGDELFVYYLEAFESAPFSEKVVEYFLTLLENTDVRAKAVSVLSKQLGNDFKNDAACFVVIPEYWKTAKDRFKQYCTKFPIPSGWQPLFCSNDTAGLKRFGGNVLLKRRAPTLIELNKRFSASKKYEIVLNLLLIDSSESKEIKDTSALMLSAHTANGDCGYTLRFQPNEFCVAGEGIPIASMDVNNTDKWAEIRILMDDEQLEYYVNGKGVLPKAKPLGKLPAPHIFGMGAGKHEFVVGGARIRVIK